MYILDFSPHHTNTSGKHNKIALNANTRTQYTRVYRFMKAYFDADFPNGLTADYKTARNTLHGNSNILLECYYNSILDRYEIHFTNKRIMRNNQKYFKYDFVGNLTEYAQNISV